MQNIRDLYALHHLETHYVAQMLNSLECFKLEICVKCLPLLHYLSRIFLVIYED